MSQKAQTHSKEYYLATANLLFLNVIFTLLQNLKDTAVRVLIHSARYVKLLGFLSELFFKNDILC